ncbi:MAG TPA: Asp-tRNA(Asn)/Glu-tRNA(Gln) amidotransferase subunit GatA [Atribacter sp.]|jgi:aspartyl-tRNA(Asn)/glutamyl-tRNA(Gln) amidotransferase subunit A|uniref:Glutamyl-tRNA(Gln) amidotransferase subunit A n=1 Tax=Candidatus Atribacter allofermentans TaxID=1852833 RepID=A0A1V5T480_9BACT|nr:Asp-tRNA(Asn)/Glu-tRNA(Gln) amidotransferase subunit GatA [Atribacter sp.]MDD3714383.1 Asp-tRNA(Asn)/Glu-tRNA(Gln) amidotransferase subunit GatA [Atribacterota bacterium]OQA61323.1 MAG: Glutamyl-tRNA(Gln) amidotransferase subunit A [Candidatus Atribacteria bacterium ADurb.Bin276]HHT09258.1 Asp-tRNA(Asn)/Glu-tRNA(Gln) amidotransferase subunit GatA [Candidatus Atribacteria bacterium]MDI9595816.1 Asp-tRNA(Asn)/Glu-tRNA(Gln) amidotransferase subunit GatA [Atribacterota bacterium]HQK82397.1 Asp-
MNIDTVKNFTVEDYQNAYKNEEISPTEITQLFLDRIHLLDPSLRAFLTIDETGALQRARELEEKKFGEAEFPPLYGIPIAIKDNICIQGLPTTCGSRILSNYHSPFDATVIEKIKKAGGIFLGKTNMDEFAMGSSTENSGFGPTRNPFDPNRVPGGSSGGSAASVAALEAPLALGSDTGGSVRQPAAFCGIVGLRPTYGRVSRYGLISFASSLDQIGTLTRSVQDSRALFSVISGQDDRDSTCAPYPPFSSSDCLPEDEIKKMKVGVAKEYFSTGIDPSITQRIQEVLNILAKEGFEVVEVSLPHTDYALEAYYIVAPAEASSNLARYDGIAYGYRCHHPLNLQDLYTRTRTTGFGKEVLRRIILGTYCLSSGYYDEFYLKGMQVRTLVKKDFEESFEKCDILLTPTTPSMPFKFGEKSHDPYQMYLTDVFTIPSAMAGIPALSLNCGYHQHLPIGLQILGAPFQEGKIFSFASFLEKILSISPPDIGSIHSKKEVL